MTATLDDQVRLMESAWFMSYPHDVYARLRREVPVYWSPRDELWAISKYEDIRWISKQPELFSNRYHIYVAGAKVDDDGQAIPDDTGMPRPAELRRVETRPASVTRPWSIRIRPSERWVSRCSSRAASSCSGVRRPRAMSSEPS